jgi:hypothetical protein
MGALILGRKDDGTLEIVRADDEIEFDEEVLEDMATEGDYRRDGQTVKVDASNGFVAYTLVEYLRDTHSWRAVKTQADGQ